MLSNYLIVHKSILPEYYEKVLACRRLMESGKCKEVSQAVKQVGISRSTYYKYKDYIFEPTDLNSSRKAVFSMMLDHAPGVLSSLLARISDCGASVLTITQSLPIQNKASVTISIDITDVKESVDEFSARLSSIPGLDNLRLLAIE
jgi:chorismate mutase